MYMGGEGIYTFTFEYEKKENCPVCGDAVSFPSHSFRLLSPSHLLFFLSQTVTFNLSPELTLEELIEKLGADVNMFAPFHLIFPCFSPIPDIHFYFLFLIFFPSKSIPASQMKKPSLMLGGKPLYMQAPPPLEEATRPNLSKKLADLMKTGASLTVTDRSLPFALELVVNFK
jgi:ubiquitin-activating enzyme E1 C